MKPPTLLSSDPSAARPKTRTWYGSATGETGSGPVKFANFTGPLPVSPVADPYQVRVFGRAAEGSEESSVGGFMPRPCGAGPSFREVRVADYVAIGQHAVVVAQIIGGHGGRIGKGAVVRVVEE